MVIYNGNQTKIEELPEQVKKYFVRLISHCSLPANPPVLKGDIKLFIEDEKRKWNEEDVVVEDGDLLFLDASLRKFYGIK